MHIIKLLRNSSALKLMVISTITFALIYKLLGNNGFYRRGDHQLGWVDSFYFSTSTQTLLGFGDITPETHIAKIIVIIQVFVTIVITFLFAGVDTKFL